MSSATIAALRAELLEQQAALADPLEGLEDFVRVGNGVDGEKDMRSLAQAGADRYHRRLSLVAAALTAIDALEEDGFPPIPLLDVPASQFELFRRNQQTISAAVAVLNPIEPANGGEVRFGEGRLRDGVQAPAGAAART